VKTLRLPARMENLSVIRSHGLEQALRAGMPEERARKVALVIEESLVNVVQYAYPESTGDVELSCHLDEGLFYVCIRDWGRPFDPTGCKEPDVEACLEERELGGLGIHFIRSLADRFEYSWQEQANSLTMCFRVGP
jgi:serine/threonine-protein kinase RsbW